MDFGGIFIDPLNTGRTAFEFFVNPRNVQYDAVTDDASGENSSPDFFWDSAARITERRLDRRDADSVLDPALPERSTRRRGASSCFATTRGSTATS